MAVGAVFEGYKGGQYCVTPDTGVRVSEYGRDFRVVDIEGVALRSVNLSLAPDMVTEYRSGQPEAPASERFSDFRRAVAESPRRSAVYARPQKKEKKKKEKKEKKEVDRYRKFVKHRQRQDWGDLAIEISSSYSGVWSMKCSRILYDLLYGIELVGPTPPEDVPWSLLVGGVYEAVTGNDVSACIEKYRDQMQSLDTPLTENETLQRIADEKETWNNWERESFLKSLEEH